MRGRPASLLLAVGFDLLLSELPNRWHPVVWIGRSLAWAERRAGTRGIVEGAAALLAVGAPVTGVAALLANTARRLGGLGVLVEAGLLKPAFAARRLGTAAGEVQDALRAGDLDGARHRLGRHLVSRETTQLSSAEVTSAAVESVAENLTDSLTGPLLAYAVGGLPAAWTYRVLNTADAMWGYRDARYERFGKVAARLDDAANLVPARVAALALAAGAALVGENGGNAWRMAWRDHARTPSPNAGWTVAAMAGALGVGLEKARVYRLGDGALPGSPDAIRRAVRVFAAAGALVVAVTLAIAAVRRERG